MPFIINWYSSHSCAKLYTCQEKCRKNTTKNPDLKPKSPQQDRHVKYYVISNDSIALPSWHVFTLFKGIYNIFSHKLFSLLPHVHAARCSSVVRAFAHGAMGRRIDPSWGGPMSNLWFQSVLHDWCNKEGHWRRKRGGKGGMCPPTFLLGGAMVCLCPPHFLPHILIFHLNYMFI